MWPGFTASARKIELVKNNDGQNLMARLLGLVILNISTKVVTRHSSLDSQTEALRNLLSYFI